ncbi:MAG: site-specific integrase [bacterium]|nr:site-specific integrase [bacterium]
MGHVVHFPPAASPEPDHPLRHVPSLAGAVEAFLGGRALAAATRRTYRQALGPLVEALDGDCPVTDLDADRVAAVFAERWDGCAAATWNTRRVAVQAFTTWCQERWPLAEVAPRRRQADNTRAIPLGGSRGVVAPADGAASGEDPVADAV